MGHNGIISRRETADLKNQTSFTRGRLDTDRNGGFRLRGIGRKNAPNVAKAIGVWIDPQRHAQGQGGRMKIGPNKENWWKGRNPLKKGEDPSLSPGADGYGLELPPPPPVSAYMVMKDLPRHWVKILPLNCEIKAGEICRYFEHNDIYLFDAREGHVPYVERRHVEKWRDYFEPVLP